MPTTTEAAEWRVSSPLTPRKKWTTVLATVCAVGALAVLLAIGFAFSGFYDVGASTRHWSLTEWYLNLVRTHSIRAYAAKIQVPPGYSDATTVVDAVGHYVEHCATCHGAPGVQRKEVAVGMYPQPPDLTNVSKRYTPSELFWIIKNGIKMSAMPSMADDGDDMLWATVGVLEKLPGMSADVFNDLWMAAQAQGGHSHMMNMENSPVPEAAAPAGPASSSQTPGFPRSPQEGGHRH